MIEPQDIEQMIDVVEKASGLLYSLAAKARREGDILGAKRLRESYQELEDFTLRVREMVAANARQPGPQEAE